MVGPARVYSSFFECEFLRQTLGSSAKLDDAATVALGGAALGQWRELLHGLAFGGQLEAGFLAGFGFAIEGLRHGGGTAHVAEREDFDVEFSAFIFDGEHVAVVDLAGGFGLDTI